MNPDLRDAIAELLARASEVGESGLWTVIAHDPVSDTWRTEGPYDHAHALIEMQRTIDSFAATAGMHPDDDLTGCRVYLARHDPGEEDHRG